MATGGQGEFDTEQSGHLISVAREIEQVFPSRCLKDGRGCDAIRDIADPLAQLVDRNVLTISEAKEQAYSALNVVRRQCIGRVGLDACVSDDCGLVAELLRAANRMVNHGDQTQTD